MEKIKAATCEHVFCQIAIKTDKYSHQKFFIISDEGEQKLVEGWRYCPVCGKEILWCADKEFRNEREKV